MLSMKPILLVEDDKVDTMTVKRALKEVKVTNKLLTCSNGEEALEYLKDANNDRPCIILLDLNMPKMNGIEFMREARKAEMLNGIPVIVLTTSKEEQDRMESYDLCAAGYMLKPVDYRQFVEVIKAIDVYWTISQLPE